MSKKNNTVCSICGTPYHLCISCKDTMNLHPWKIHCCSSECYKVFQILKGFNNNIYTKEEARNRFKNVNLENIESFVPHIKKTVKDIIKEEHIIKDMNMSIEEDVVVKEEIVAEKPIYSRKKNYKIEKVDTDEEICNEIEISNDDVDAE